MADGGGDGSLAAGRGLAENLEGEKRFFSDCKICINS